MQHTPFKKTVIALLAGIIFFVGSGGEVAIAAGPGALNTGTIQQDNSTLGVSCISATFPYVSLNGCLAQGVYYLIYKPASIILVASVEIFDAVLTMSIDRTFIEKGFVDDLWKIARDFSNMAFIFVLLYAGVQTMLGMGNWQKTVLNVVIIALLINFSLFFTKIIIDAGNILAVGIYSSMGVGTPGTNAWGGAVESRGLGEAVAGAFQPQKFLATAGASPTDALVTFVIATGVSLLVAWAFFKAAMVFVGRILAFWFLMIVSPFAFISFAFPQGNKFNEWFRMLMDQAMVAPVFLFFMYMIMMAVQGGTSRAGLFDSFTHDTGSGFVFDKLFVPCIIAILIYTAIKFAVEYAEKTSGAFGKIGAQIAGAVVGVAAGGAGLASVAGTQALSALGGKLGERGGALGAIGKAATKTSHAAREFTFDARNIKVPLTGGGTVGSLTGIGKGGTTTLETQRKAAVAEAIKPAPKPPESIAQSVAKAKEKKDALEAKKKAQIERLEAKEKKLTAELSEAVQVFKESIGLKNDTRNLNDIENLQELRSNKFNELEGNLAQMEAKLAAVDKKNIDAHAVALVEKKRAERNFKKFEGMHTDIERIERELKGTTKEREESTEKIDKALKEMTETKKEEKKEEKH